MKEADFRVKHSEMIEYYQLIEFHLKGICASLLADGDRGWLDRLNDYETDTMGQMLRKIRSIQAQKQISLLSSEDLDTLDSLRKKRNYWIHLCFIDYVHVSFRKGEVKHPDHAIKITQDLQEAIEWDEKLAEIARSLP